MTRPGCRGRLLPCCSEGCGPSLEPIATTTQDDELARYLASLERDDCYRPVRRLGTSREDASLEGGLITELVMFEGANGSQLGPFVRKRMPREAGVGSVYETLFQLQRAGARFVHLPRIVECYRTAREIVAISEYVEGASLDELVKRDGGGLNMARIVFPALCDAVSELHELADPPLIHRDVKPANVIVSNTSHAVMATLIDFGIARQIRAGNDADTARFGTKAYAPPEQFGFGQTSVRSDVYALGMVLLFCLTGEEPSGQPTKEMLAERGIDDAVAAVILKATAFDPAVRFASSSELKQAFCRAVEQPQARQERQRTVTGGMPVSSYEVRSGVPPVAAPMRLVEPSSAPTMQPVVSSARSKRKRPFWAACAWDVVLALLAFAFVGQAVSSTANPSGALIGRQLWYNVAVNWFLVLPTILGILYAMLDRWPLERIFPAMAQRTLQQDVKVIVLYLLIAFAGCSVLAFILGTS